MTAITSRNTTPPIINPTLPPFFSTAAGGAGSGDGAGIGAGSGGATSGTDVTTLGADSTTVSDGISTAAGRGGSGFRFSTTVGALVGSGRGALGDVGTLSTVSTVAALTSDLVWTSFFSATVSTKSGGTASPA